MYPETQILENSDWSSLLKCLKCDETFRDKQSKLRHQRERHGMFTCLICGKAFSQRSGLSHHLPMHSEIKAFQCSVCGKCFRQRSGLTHHKQTHSEVKAFSCDVCGKAFAQGSGLIHHKSTHSLVKSFTCHICGKSFAQRSGLAHHKNIHLKKLNEVITPDSTVSSRVMNFQQYLMSCSK